MAKFSRSCGIVVADLVTGHVSRFSPPPLRVNRYPLTDCALPLRGTGASLPSPGGRTSAAYGSARLLAPEAPSVALRSPPRIPPVFARGLESGFPGGGLRPGARSPLGWGVPFFCTATPTPFSVSVVHSDFDPTLVGIARRARAGEGTNDHKPRARLARF